MMVHLFNSRDLSKDSLLGPQLLFFMIKHHENEENGHIH